MATNEFTVAIELGSSKITGIAGKKNLDGSITVLAVVKEDSSQCIRKGVVYNIDKTAQCLTNIITKLKTQLKHEISQVYVGVGGQSIRSVRNVIVKELPQDTIITEEMIDELQDTNRTMNYTDQEILSATTQEFKVDNQLSRDPVGIKANRLEGNFLNVLWRKSFYNNLYSCFNKANISIAETYLAPLTLANSVLSEAEQRGGCVLVDLGADTTTVSVYYKNLLRHIAVIPLGGNNITKDIASLQMEEKDAEAMKLKYASAYTEISEIDSNKKYPIDSDRYIGAEKFVQIVEARLQEIIENVGNQVPTEYADKLLGGIVLTGGGSNMKNIEKAFRVYLHVEKVHCAKFVTQTITSSNADINAHDGRMNTILSLLAKGNMDCAGGEVRSDLFGGTNEAAATNSATSNKEPRGGSERILTPAEKEKLDAERRKKEEEEERLKQEAVRQQKEEEEKRQNKPINKIGRKLKTFFKGVMSAEEE